MLREIELFNLFLWNGLTIPPYFSWLTWGMHQRPGDREASIYGTLESNQM